MADDKKPTMHGPNVFVCSFPECGKFFHKMSRLLIHLRSHTGERPFVCENEDCLKSYARAAHLKRHVQSAHVSPEDKAPHVRVSYRCPYEDCGLTVVSQWNLTKHIRRKHQSQEYVCQVETCGKRCKSTKQLKRHERLHHSIDPFKCTHEGCGKVFTCDSRLKAHQKVHEGYKCQYEGCAEILTSWTLLRKHIAVAHKVPAELECRLCNKKFVNKSNLKMHMLVHSENRHVLECPRENCTRVYLDKRNLDAHIRSYHDGKRIACTHEGCTRTFSYKKKMLLHLALHDPNRPLPKKKRKKKVAGISGSECPLKKKRKKRHRKNIAAQLCGLDGPQETVTGEGVAVMETDEDDQVVLSGSETEAGCKIVTGWELLLPKSPCKKPRQDRKHSHGAGTASITGNEEDTLKPECTKSKTFEEAYVNIPKDNKGQTFSTTESADVNLLNNSQGDYEKDGRKTCTTTSVVSAETKDLFEVCHVVTGPSLTMTTNGESEVSSPCDSDPELPKHTQGAKGLILKPVQENSDACDPNETSETFISDVENRTQTKDVSAPLVAWDIIAISKSSAAEGKVGTGVKDSGDVSKQKELKLATRVDVKRCLILDEISGFEKCGMNNNLCIPVGEVMLNSKDGTVRSSSVFEENPEVE